MIRFEKVSRFANDEEVKVPVRKTAKSAGYDFMVAEDTIIPSYPADLLETLISAEPEENKVMTLEELAAITKRTGAKPTLVPTGIKCELNSDTYLELSVRSSTPLKYWSILANGVGIIDADYYNNPDNEGEIFFQVINLSPYTIQLKKGDAIGQGIIKRYMTTYDDNAEGERVGGFGSTGAR